MNLEYNSHREPLMISEYGRHVQKLVDYAIEIKDKEQRQLFVDMLVNLMYQISPGAKSSKEQADRLWNHVFRIADYKLDVTPPEDVVIVTKEDRKKPHELKYPKTNPKYKHYGFHVQQLIEKAGQIDDLEKRLEFANAIGSYMKMAARTWSHEQNVNDEMIKNDLRTMSDKRLNLADEVSLNYLGNIQHVQRKKKTHKALSPSQHQGKKNKNRKRHNKRKF